MNLTEKLAYIKGLADGLKLDESKDEVKVLKALIDAVDDIAFTVEHLEEDLREIVEEVDEIDEDLANLEEDFYDDCDCDCDCDECDCECDCDDCDCDDEAYYEVTCGNCGETICVTEEVLLCGEINCPKCNELLEFDFSDLDCCDDDCDDDCDGGCCCCHE